MKKNLILPLLLISSIALSQTGELNITPRPVEVKLTNSSQKFTLDRKTKIIFGNSNKQKKTTEYFNAYLLEHYGFELSVQDHLDKWTTNDIQLRIETKDDEHKDKYSLDIDKNSITLSSSTQEGMFYGIQTLIQLLPKETKPEENKKLQIAALTINDYPRFAYRGMHLDVARHFFPTSYIKKYIDYLALHKFNYFHWHLT